MICHHCGRKTFGAPECPHCHMKQDQTLPFHLPVGTTPAGKYMINRVVDADDTGITYTALDLEKKRFVTLIEYFPPALVGREIVGRAEGACVSYFRLKGAELRTRSVPTGSIVRNAGVSDDAVENGKQRFFRLMRERFSKAGEAVDFFEENNTVYVAAAEENPSSAKKTEPVQKAKSTQPNFTMPEQKSDREQRAGSPRPRNEGVQPQIAANVFRTVGLKRDGTVVAAGLNLSGDVSDWNDIIEIAAGKDHTVGLRCDGTVMAVGIDHQGQCKVGGWRDIVAVAAGGFHTVGLKRDGTVVATPVLKSKEDRNQSDVGGWRDIVVISAGGYHTVGLKKDGTVVATEVRDKFFGKKKNFGQSNVAGWKDIVAISAGLEHTVGLKKDGTVVAVGRNDNGQCNVGEWRDIIAISAGMSSTLGLKKNGTVVAATPIKSDSGDSAVDGWTDIVAIAAGGFHTVGLKKDGTVVAVGSDIAGSCNVGGWNLN